MKSAPHTTLHIFHLLHFLILSLFSWLFHCDIYISTPKEFPAVFLNIVTAIKEAEFVKHRPGKSYRSDNVTEEENK